MNERRQYDSSSQNFEIEFIGPGGLKGHTKQLTAALVFVIDNGRILGVQNKRGWDIPGGHIEDGESPEQAALREVFEEACVEIGTPKPFALIKNGNTAMAVFTAEAISVNDFVPAEEDPITDRAFMGIDDFMELYSGGDKAVMSQLVGKLARLA